MKISSLLHFFSCHVDRPRRSSQTLSKESSIDDPRLSEAKTETLIQPLSTQPEIAVAINAVAMIGAHRVSVADQMDPRLRAVIMLQKAKRILTFGGVVEGRSLAQDISRRMPRFRLGAPITQRQKFQSEAVYQLSKQVIDDDLQGQPSVFNIKVALQKYDQGLKDFDRNQIKINEN